MRSRTMLALCGAALASVVAGPAYAWDGITSAVVVGMDISSSETILYFQNYPVVCSTGPQSAYLAPGDANYAAYVSAAESAMALKTTVIAYTTRDGGGCHIGVLTVGGTPYPP